jgi:hypothetical protein
MSNPEDPTQKFHRLTNSEAETRPDSPVAHTPPHGSSRPPRSIEIDENGLPLPKHVDELDLGATQVAPSAFEHTTIPIRRRQGRSSRVPGRHRPSFSWSRLGGCLLRGMIVLVFGLVGLGLLLAAAAIYEYYSIASTLPSVGDLQQRASQFETTRILDRNGDVLYEILDPQAGRRTYVPLAEISPALVAATLSTEDKDFYTHGGFDPLAIARAFWQT